MAGRGAGAAAGPDRLVDETPDHDGAFPRLTDAQLTLLARVGTRRPVAPGETLYRAADPGYDFYVVLSGAVAIVEYMAHPDEPLITVHGERRFLGEIDLFCAQPVSRTALVIRRGEVLHVPADRRRAVLAADAELRDVVLRTFLIRRAMLLEFSADLRIVGRPGSPDTRRPQDYADTHVLTTEITEVASGNEGDRRLAALGLSEADLPVVVPRTGDVLHNPDDAELDRALHVPGRLTGPAADPTT